MLGKLSYNGLVLGEVALCVGFVRWKAILPNTCCTLFCLSVNFFNIKVNNKNEK